MTAVLLIRAVAAAVLVLCAVVATILSGNPPIAVAPDRAGRSGATGEHLHSCPDRGEPEGERWRCETPAGSLVSSWPFDAAPSIEQTSEARLFAAEVEKSAQRFVDIDNARASGYTYLVMGETERAAAGSPVGESVAAAMKRGLIEHVVNPDLMDDDGALDPSAPDSLIYAQRDGRSELVGVMFTAPFGVDGPQIGGPWTVWHTHHDGDLGCYSGTRPTGFARYGPSDERGAPTGGCAVGGPVRESPQMLHVWFEQTDLEATFDADMEPARLESVLTGLGS